MYMDNHIQIIGIVAAYDIDKNGMIMPFVYQILGENIRRINLDNNGCLNYNCVYLEKTPLVGKLLQQTQIKNGDIWEENPAVKLRCDLYSISKSIDICRFMLRTSHYLKANQLIIRENKKLIISTQAKVSYYIHITKDKVEVKLMDI